MQRMYKTVTTLTPELLLSNDVYQQQRNSVRQQMIDYKNHRRIALGPHATLFFESKKTIWYQIQEMLITEKITDPKQIQREVDTYSSLIPDGENWKITLMFEFPDMEERKKQLHELNGAEFSVWCDINDCVRMVAIPDEDLPLSDDEKTSAVHFLRFHFNSEHIQMLKTRLPMVSFGITHPHYTYSTIISEEMLKLLVEDLG